MAFDFDIFYRKWVVVFDYHVGDHDVVKPACVPMKLHDTDLRPAFIRSSVLAGPLLPLLR
jgi:hypothetical protein